MNLGLKIQILISVLQNYTSWRTVNKHESAIPGISGWPPNNNLYIFFPVGYLTMLLVSRLHNVGSYAIRQNTLRKKKIIFPRNSTDGLHGWNIGQSDVMLVFFTSISIIRYRSIFRRYTVPVTGSIVKQQMRKQKKVRPRTCMKFGFRVITRHVRNVRRICGGWSSSD
jgi:hypothetical protein